MNKQPMYFASRCEKLALTQGSHKIAEKNSIVFQIFPQPWSLLFHRLSQQKLNEVMTFIYPWGCNDPVYPMNNNKIWRTNWNYSICSKFSFGFHQIPRVFHVQRNQSHMGSCILSSIPVVWFLRLNSVAELYFNLFHLHHSHFIKSYPTNVSKITSSITVTVSVYLLVQSVCPN